jgi:hypothetical protein
MKDDVGAHVVRKEADGFGDVDIPRVEDMRSTELSCESFQNGILLNDDDL